ncbi:hypothetical protein M8J77_006972 [Diaphorina citri]|nr:hypothetical protein M8J77_006972 [Diaphorina citri]
MRFSPYVSDLCTLAIFSGSAGKIGILPCPNHAIFTVCQRLTYAGNLSGSLILAIFSGSAGKIGIPPCPNHAIFVVCQRLTLAFPEVLGTSSCASVLPI